MPYRDKELHKAYLARNHGKIRARDLRYCVQHREEAKARASKWYYANKERARKSAKAWAQKNRAKMRAYRVVFLEKNKEKNAAWQKKYWQSPKGKASKASRAHVRRVRVMSSEKRATAKEIAEVLASPACFYCGKSGVKITLDHYMPLALGGGHCKSNLVGACATCNKSKGAKDLVAFMFKSDPMLQ